MIIPQKCSLVKYVRHGIDKFLTIFRLFTNNVLPCAERKPVYERFLMLFCDLDT